MQRDESVKTKSEQVGYRIGFWAVKLGRSIIEIAMSYLLVGLADGAFQTTVICLLGLIYKRIRFVYLDKLVSDEMLAFSISRSAMFVKNNEDTFEQYQHSIAEYLRESKSVATTIVIVEDWILNAVFVLPLVKLCLTSVLG